MVLALLWAELTVGVLVFLEYKRRNAAHGVNEFSFEANSTTPGKPEKWTKTLLGYMFLALVLALALLGTIASPPQEGTAT
jgi:hypothetical protein